MDVVVAERADGTLLSTPFHVVFSKFRALQAKDRTVLIRVNSQSVSVRMKLSANGVAYFDAQMPKETSFPVTVSMPVLPQPASGEISSPPEAIAAAEGPVQTTDTSVPPDTPVKPGDRQVPCMRICRAATLSSLGEDERGRRARLPAAEDRLRASPAVLACLGLRPGRNSVEFTCWGTFGQQTTLTSCIYFYPHCARRRIIVSDIDGTITKSDVRGHLLGMLSINYLHDSICELYSELERRGYTFIYLTARPLALAELTHRYLCSVSQRGCKLPRGPLLVSSDGVFLSFKREFYHKNTDVFKATCLRDLACVFDCAEHSQLFAGFGNRGKDTRAYQLAGIAPNRIFEIRDRGLLHNLATDENFSYAALRERIGFFFPTFLSAEAHC